MQFIKGIFENSTSIQMSEDCEDPVYVNARSYEGNTYPDTAYSQYFYPDSLQLLTSSSEYYEQLKIVNVFLRLI